MHCRMIINIPSLLIPVISLPDGPTKNISRHFQRFRRTESSRLRTTVVGDGDEKKGWKSFFEINLEHASEVKSTIVQSSLRITLLT